MTEGARRPRPCPRGGHEGRGGARSSTSAARRRRSRLGSVASPSTAVVPRTPTPTADAVSHGPPHRDANGAPRETGARTSWIRRPAHPDVVTRSHRWRRTHGFRPDHQPAAHHHPTTSASASYGEHDVLEVARHVADAVAATEEAVAHGATLAAGGGGRHGPDAGGIGGAVAVRNRAGVAVIHTIHGVPNRRRTCRTPGRRTSARSPG